MPNGIQDFLPPDFLGAGTTPQQVPDPWTKTPFGPLAFDPEATNYPQTQGQTVETAVKSMDLNENGNDVPSQYVAALMEAGGDDEEIRNILNMIMGAKGLIGNQPLGGLDAWMEGFKQFGIDIPEMIETSKKRKSGGLPYIAAGQALVEASRRGYNVPQALTQMFTAFGATRDKLSQVDPTLFKLASAFLENASKTSSLPLKGVHVLGVGDDIMNDAQISNYRAVNGPGSIIFEAQKPKGEDVQDFWVYDPTTKDWDIQTMASLKAQDIRDAGGQAIQWSDGAENKIIPVVDTKSGDVDTMTMGELKRAEFEATINGEEFTLRGFPGTGTVLAENAITKELKEFPKLALTTTSLGDTWNILKTDNQPYTQVTLNPDGGITSVTGFGKNDTNAGPIFLKEWQESAIADGNLLNETGVILSAITGAVDELQGVGGLPARTFLNWADLWAGGAKEALQLMGIKDRDDIMFYGEDGEALGGVMEYKTRWINQLDGNTSWGKIKDSLFNNLNAQGRRESSAALENSLFALTLHMAMGAFEMTSRAISDRDMQFFQRLVGQSRGSVGTMMRSVLGAIDTKIITKSDQFWANAPNRDPGAEYQDPKTLGWAVEPILVKHGYYEKSDDPEKQGLFPVSGKWNAGTGYQANTALKEQMKNASAKYLSQGGAERKAQGTTNAYGGIDIVAAIDDLPAGVYPMPDGPDFDFNRNILSTKYAMPQDFSPKPNTTTGGVKVNSLLNDLVTQGQVNKDEVDFQNLLNIYSLYIFPLMQKEKNKGVRGDIQEAYLTTFFGNDEETKAKFVNTMKFIVSR